MERSPAARLNYVEFPSRDIAGDKRFYEAVFGWSLTEFGPTYASTMTGDTDIGLQADADEAPAKPLPVVQVADLEAALERARSAGSLITREIFSFPGGRRFQCCDASGNEIAVMQGD